MFELVNYVIRKLEDLCLHYFFCNSEVDPYASSHQAGADFTVSILMCNFELPTFAVLKLNLLGCHSMSSSGRFRSPHAKKVGNLILFFLLRKGNLILFFFC